MPDYGMINDRSPHIIADLCEIVSYFEKVPVSKSDIEGFIANKGGAGLLSELTADNDAEANDKLQRLTEDAFQHLAYRARAFGDWYPFTVEHDILETREDIDDRKLIYAALLTSSRLKMFEPAQRIAMASEFEFLCCKAIPSLLPGWTIIHFGTGGADRLAFGNPLRAALPALVERIREISIPLTINELSEQDMGDAGIDLVAVYEWDDPARSVPVYFGQCAAQQQNWPEKKFEAHPATHDRFMSFFHKPGVFLFIPVCYRGPDGKWVDTIAHATILVDRLRLVKLMELALARGTATLADILATVPSRIQPGAYQSAIAAA